MKILLLTDYYPPESNAPALRCSYHAEYWAKKGHDVTVLTCAPNFPNGILAILLSGNLESHHRKALSGIIVQNDSQGFHKGLEAHLVSGRLLLGQRRNQ